MESNEKSVTERLIDAKLKADASIDAMRDKSGDAKEQLAKTQAAMINLLYAVFFGLMAVIVEMGKE